MRVINPKPFEACFQQYREAVISKEAGPNQISESRKAFFSGAIIIFQMFLDIEGRKLNEADIAAWEILHRELKEFGRLLDLETLPAEGEA